MEDFTIPQESNKNCSPSGGEVCMNFREVNDGPFLNNTDESIAKENGSATKKVNQIVKVHCKTQQRAVFSGKILSFRCSLCKDNLTYSPNDLFKHFEVAHEGSLPTYPCDLCDFVTNEFSALQRHRIEHRNTLVTCELCNDRVQYSLLLLTRHYIMCHSINGEFKCDWCLFTTMDAGTFVQHIHHHNESHRKCSKCKHISLNEEAHQVHMMGHFGTFPFTCQICGFGTAESEHLKSHTAAVHKQEAHRTNAPKAAEESPANLSSNTKLYKKIGISHETGSVSNENGRVAKQELHLEELHHPIDGTVGRKDNRSWSFHNAEQSTPVMIQECENANNSETGSHANGLTVLRVKNKISLPPNCTTKVIGFKMVDGKKHLVLKVIPASKQDVGHFAKRVDSVEKEQHSEHKGSTSKVLSISPRNGASIQVDHDAIMAVKVKIEEEETSVCTLSSSDGEQKHLLPTRPKEDTHRAAEAVCTERGKLTVANGSDPAKITRDGASHGSKNGNTDATCEANVLPSRTVFSEPLEKSGETDESLFKNYKGNSVTNTVSSDSSCQTAPVTSNGPSVENRSQICLQPVKGLESPSQLAQTFPVCSEVENSATRKDDPKTSNQEVFTFHNYSKEMFTSSPGSAQNPPSTGEHLESNKVSLRLPESLDHTTANTDGEEANGCAANDDLLTEENGDLVLKDFNVIKIEEDGIPISTKQSEPKTSLHSMESFVKEHSNAIITQPLNKERTGPLNPSNAFLTQATTPLNILQLPGGKQPVLVRAAPNTFAMPVHIKATPGFKLITSSPNPQVSSSCMTRELNNLMTTSGVTLAPKARIVGVAAGTPQATEKGTALSAVQAGGSTASNHYFINRSGFKGPVLLSRALHSTPATTVAKTQPTCYFVQRSVPSVPSTVILRPPGPQLPLNPQPVVLETVAEKAGTPQPSRQAYLLRYISPSRSSLLANKQESKNTTIWNQTSECSGNKVIFKIVSPTARISSTVACTPSGQPLLLATRPQGQCLLVSANKTTPTSCEVKKLVSVQSDLQEHQKEPRVSPLAMNGNLQPCEANRLPLAPRVIGQRKRHRKALFAELPAALHKARKLSNKAQTEKGDVLWTPVGRAVERTLRLAPFSTEQQVKHPCRYQPVVVLNHPDADIPEVINIMKAVGRHKGAVTKVALSQKTVRALSELSGLGSKNGDVFRARPVLSSVRERFLLKLKLRKKNRKKYQVVKTLSARGRESVVFHCWYCGRLFSNQEDWIGHGQRHLMEATRDWNKLF